MNTSDSTELDRILDNFSLWVIKNVEHGIYIPLPSPEAKAQILSRFCPVEDIRKAIKTAKKESDPVLRCVAYERELKALGIEL